MVRSCYTAPARWETSGPVGSIKFFFSKPGAVWYPEPHVFWPRSQELQHPNTIVGELTDQGPRRYFRGTRPTGADGEDYEITPTQALGEQLYHGPTPRHLVPMCRLPLTVGLGVNCREHYALPTGTAMAAQVCHNVLHQLPTGTGMGAKVCYHTWEELPTGTQMDGAPSPPSVVGSITTGTEMEGAPSPPLVIGSITTGTEMEGAPSPPLVIGSITSGTEMDGAASPPSVVGGLTTGTQMDGNPTSGGGDVAPDTTCAGAPTITLPFTHSDSIGSSVQHWWKFSGTAGTRYKLTLSQDSGFIGGGSLYTGSCGTPVQQVDVLGPSFGCQSFVLGSDGTIWVQIRGPLISSGTYTVTVATGNC